MKWARNRVPASTSAAAGLAASAAAGDSQIGRLPERLGMRGQCWRLLRQTWNVVFGGSRSPLTPLFSSGCGNGEHIGHRGGPARRGTLVQAPAAGRRRTSLKARMHLTSSFAPRNGGATFHEVDHVRAVGSSDAAFRCGHASPMDWGHSALHWQGMASHRAWWSGGGVCSSVIHFRFVRLQG